MAAAHGKWKVTRQNLYLFALQWPLLSMGNVYRQEQLRPLHLQSVVGVIPRNNIYDASHFDTFDASLCILTRQNFDASNRILTRQNCDASNPILTRQNFDASNRILTRQNCDASNRILTRQKCDASYRILTRHFGPLWHEFPTVLTRHCLWRVSSVWRVS